MLWYKVRIWTVWKTYATEMLIIWTLVEWPSQKILFKRPRCMWEDNIKTKIGCVDVDWIQDSTSSGWIQWQAYVNRLWTFMFHINRDFLTSWVTIRFHKRPWIMELVFQLAMVCQMTYIFPLLWSPILQTCKFNKFTYGYFNKTKVLNIMEIKFVILNF
jgi:hypothetical protein